MDPRLGTCTSYPHTRSNQKKKKKAQIFRQSYLGATPGFRRRGKLGPSKFVDADPVTGLGLQLLT